MQMEMAKSAAKATKQHLRRFSGWWLSAAIALGIVSWVAPQQLEVVVYKIFLVNVGVVLGYIADRSLFSGAPDYIDESLSRDILGAARLIVRGLVTIGTILGMTLGI